MFEISWETPGKNYWYNIFSPGNPQEILNVQELPDNREFQTFQHYSGCEYSREISNMLESSLN